MALRTGNTTSAKVLYGTLGAYSPTKMTWAGWIAADAATGGRQIFQKQDSGDANANLWAGFYTGSGQLRCSWLRATTNMLYITANNIILPLLVPHFVAFVIDSGGSAGNIVKFYVGTLNDPPTLATLATGDPNFAEGSGAFRAAVGSYSLAASTAGGGSAQSGQMVTWIHWLFDEQTLTFEQVLALYNGFMPAKPKCWHVPGKNGLGPVIDESGNGYHGIISGAVLTNDYLPRVFRKANYGRINY